MTIRDEWVVQQGATFEKTYRWETQPIVYKDITAITQAAPVSITAVGHGVPDGWRVAVSNVKGMTEINAENEPPRPEEYLRATVVDVDTIELNSVNAVGFSTYTSGGVLRYYTPKDLTGYTARLQIREYIDDDTAVVDLTTENGGITLTAAEAKIEILIEATATAALDFEQGVFHLEMVSSSGVVTRLLEGTVRFSREATR